MIAAGQQSLFGEPALVAASSQWFTPQWVCRRAAAWIPLGRRVLECCCGSGNMIDALLRAGHAPESITGIELDPHWAQYARDRFEGRVDIHNADFLAMQPSARSERSTMHDVVLSNFPFEDNLHLTFTLHALKFAPIVIGVFPVGFEFSRERDAELWATKGVVVRRAKLPERVDYGGTQSPSFDSEVLTIARRREVRKPDEVVMVAEETWRRAA